MDRSERRGSLVPDGGARRGDGGSFLGNAGQAWIALLRFLMYPMDQPQGATMNITPVYVAGNSTIHAGRQIGTYKSGSPRFCKLCSGNGSQNHEPGALQPGTPVTCKRCLAKTTAALAPAKPAALAVDA